MWSSSGQERTDFKEDDNPISQILNYVRVMRLGGARKEDGQTIEGLENTPFYCYAIATLTPQLRDLAEYEDFIRTPDGRGFFRFHARYNAYIEILSYDKVLAGCQEKKPRVY